MFEYRDVNLATEVGGSGTGSPLAMPRGRREESTASSPRIPGSGEGRVDGEGAWLMAALEEAIHAKQS
jgi:hypothetical protein